MMDEIKNSIGNMGANSENIYKDELGNSHYRTCFTNGTLVSTKDAKKPIETIRLGEKVLSKNEITGELEYKTVTKLFENEVTLLFKLTMSGGKIIETTWNHPFMIKGRGWTLAKDLQIGDESILQDGHLTQIQSIEQVHVAPTKVYNIEVEDFHTYFVGEDGVWVHNYEQVNDKSPGSYANSGFFQRIGERFSNMIDGNGFNTDFEAIETAGAQQGLAAKYQMALDRGYAVTTEQYNYTRAVYSNERFPIYQADGTNIPQPFNENTITSNFGPRDLVVNGKSLPQHYGTDYGISKGTPVPNGEEGTVYLVETHDGYGKRVIVDHGRYFTQNSHLDTINPAITVGSRVKIGQTIGTVGSTGSWTTGAHDHFMVYEKNRYGQPGRIVNPRSNDF